MSLVADSSKLSKIFFRFVSDYWFETKALAALIRDSIREIRHRFFGTNVAKKHELYQPRYSDELNERFTFRQVKLKVCAVRWPANGQRNEGIQLHKE